ncbi:MAG: S66 family peptidase [Candidatus Woesearchaeota archaeon]
MYPKKLEKGDEIRIIAPSLSFSVISKEQRRLAKKRLEELGLKVTYSKNIEESDIFSSSSIKSRVEDIHEAFKDKNVKAIMTVLGGHNANQLLDYIDFELIKNNPKIFCGYSDITALQAAILKKTGLVTYSGPHFATFAQKKGFEYTLQYFKKTFFEKKQIEIRDSKEWSDDEWWLDQENRSFIPNKGSKVYREGTAKGEITGGNICTLNLLQGTPYMPDINNKILFLEDDFESKALNFERDFQSLLQQTNLKKIKALVIGRFQKASEVTKEKIEQILKTKKGLENIPIIYDVDFGHTYPFFTFPIGGEAEIDTNKENKITITKHIN